MTNPQEDLFDGEIVDLVDELAECYEDDGHFPMVRHPLVVSVPHHDVQNKWANASLEFKKKKLAKAEANKDWPVSYTHLTLPTILLV